MNVLDALILGVVEGLTEFLPVSSTAHLTIAEKVLGLPVADPGVTAFTAVIQVGAIVAVLGYFRGDIIALASAWLSGLARPAARRDPQYTVAWCVILGSVPIGIVGLAARHLIAGPLRNLWVVVTGLVVWSIVMYVAEKFARQNRAERDLSLLDSVVVGLVQCLALAPGVSRSGATISAGLLRGFDRVTATRLSFFLSIPALVAAGAYEAGTAADSIAASVGWTPTVVASITSFLVAYAAIAWLLRLVAHHRITVFIGYRLALAALVGIALASRLLNPT
ncbi:undecaprenyl-diphosphate phosphatase [uncultured Friedmanniella sp.]|uniref:undecaprenyl-diphosphate phosphatase n=1 Tax=uncultured Friedmanniella sp. TaxID=335381 RepID=UPI0035CBE0FE